MNKTKKNTRGITLIALVITIIVLLILAGVTIAALSGDNGILTRAKEAKKKTEQANQEELDVLDEYEQNLNQYVDGRNVNLKNINKADTNTTEAMPENVRVLEDDANKGIIINDKNNNEWVWVEVPKTIVFSGLTIDTTKELTEQNYEDIKNKLITYATTYREGELGQGRYWTDEWYNGCGMTSDEYIAAYQKMLKSIYTYGGFWIGRYEAGIEGSIDDVAKARTSHSTITIGASPKAISQKDAIPYNYIYCTEAQALAKEMAPNSSYISSLMFGIQWDLVCKFLEVKGGLATLDINSDSSAWGNYSNAELTITSEKAKQQGTPWTVITEKKPVNKNILLTTGASEGINKMNIYDFAGNEWEWTLEKSSDNNNTCVSRGGTYYNTGSNNPSSVRDYSGTTGSGNNIGFRPTLYVDLKI